MIFCGESAPSLKPNLNYGVCPVPSSFHDMNEIGLNSHSQIFMNEINQSDQSIYINSNQLWSELSKILQYISHFTTGQIELQYHKEALLDLMI